MLILTIILAFILAPPLMLVLSRLQPKFTYYWLMAAALALAGWGSMLLVGLQLPQTTPAIPWRVEGLFSSSPSLRADSVSWPFAMAVTTMAAGVVLTGIGQAHKSKWQDWGGALGLTALGLVGVLAGNPLTLLLAWAANDLLETSILLRRLRDEKSVDKVVVTVSMRFFGIVAVLWAAAAASAAGSALEFENIPLQSSVFLFAGIMFRLGVLPVQEIFFEDIRLRRGVGTIMRLMPVASALALAARMAVSGVPEAVGPYLLWALGGGALVGGIGWLLAADELQGRRFWIMGVASLALAAALQRQLEASIAWSVLLLLEGALLFLYAARERRMLFLLALGGLWMSGAPFLPAWAAVGVYAALDASGAVLMRALLYLLAHAVLLVGFVRHARREGVSISNPVRGVRFIYPAGFVVLLIGHIIISWLPWSLSETYPLGFWQGPAVVALAILFGYGLRRIPALPDGLMRGFRVFFSFGWMFQFFAYIFLLLGRGVAFLSALLEGEAGVLWAFLLLILLLSVAGQVGGGG